MGKSSIVRTTSSPFYHQRPSNESNRWRHGPRRVISFCVFAVLCPAVFISVPLVMRFVIYGSSNYHVNPSDVRIIDEKISTIWCKKQTLKANITFTAYDSNGVPQVSMMENPLSFHKTLIIPDDYKEYWGFYLLQGSTYRISTCARFKGGTVLIVKGRHHLNYCAYIGNADSAQDSDEFSDSRSDEQNPSELAQSSQRRFHHVNPNVVSSQEEMSLLLAKIRAYVKRKPHRYYKLKEVFDLNNVFHSVMANNESVEADADAETTTSITKRSTEVVNESSVKNEFAAATTVEHHEHRIRHQKSRGLVPPVPNTVESGRIVRRRRQIEVQRNSESGENGAYEDMNEEETLSSNSSSTETYAPKTDLIWKTQHSLHSGAFNMSHSNDESNSESESSFSSSEEALAKCEGIVKMLYLKPMDKCGLENNETETIPLLFNATVESSGYYYFIFGSENEKTDNFIRLKFELEKFEFELPESLPRCVNVKSCALDLKFGSNQKMVISIPQPSPNSDDAWDEYFVMESECEPRTVLYLIFVLCLPVMILLCAFQ